MYISYNWLKDFVKIPAKIKPAQIAEELTNHTVEVENFVNQADKYNKVVVGKVLEVKKHPNADRLRLALVDVKKEKLNIVCGAPNLEEGQLVPVALVGAVLPAGVEIKESEIRGQKSNGMICAEDELGLGKNHDGIIVLDQKAKIGEPFAKYLKAEDIVFEVDNKSLSNRPDLLCHYGLARELAAIFNLDLKPYEKMLAKIESSQELHPLDIKIEAKDLCSRYTAVKIENISIKQSPAWLKERLIAIGQRPVNNIVDLTNYVMFETGQPLHAFDGENINKIAIRRAQENEVLQTLDEKERFFAGDDLLITDGKEAIAVAGIMGGQNSEVKAETKTIILESANFQALAIRKTAQKIGLRTEASVRFEKFLDPALTEIAILRFLQLLKESNPKFRIASLITDVDNSDKNELSIDFSLDWLDKKIGQEIPRTRVEEILEKLGFKINENAARIIKVSVPSWRATKDVKIKEDLVEEILRLYGYDKIESKLPYQTLSLPDQNQERTLERKAKNSLALKFGLVEAYNYSFLGEEQLKKMNVDYFSYLRLANPLSDTQTLLRQSLAPGLIQAVRNNQYKADDLGFFEIGSVFFNAAGNLKRDAEGDEVLPYQEKRLALILASDSKELFMEAKGMVASLFKSLINQEVETNFQSSDNLPGWCSKEQAGKVVLLNKEIGHVAVLDHKVRANLNLKKNAAVAEINFTSLYELIASLPPFRFKETAKYPAVERDLAFVVRENILYNDLRNEINSFNPLIKSVELFDVYSGDKLAAGQKSLAFHITYQSEDRTLTAAEVDEIQKALIEILAEKFEAKLRDF